MTKKTKIIESEPIGPCIDVEPKLYKAYSIVDDFMDESRVKFHWFCWTRENPIGPYERLIIDYEPGDYSEYSINEYFTECEIEQLREYLKRVHDLRIHIEKIILPISKNVIPYSAIGSFSLCKIYENNRIESKLIEDYYVLSNEIEYSLPFEVRGYFNLDEIVEIE